MRPLYRRILGVLVVGAAFTTLGLTSVASAETVTAKAASRSADALKLRTSLADRILTVTARDGSLHLSRTTVPSGLIGLQLTNAGQADHEALLMKLNPGVTAQQYADTLATAGLGAANALLVYSGGANVVGPGKTQLTAQTLTAGDYLVLSYAQDENAVPDVMKGMLTPLTVVDDATPAVTVPPSLIKGVINGHDMTFDLPATLRGPGVFQFTVTDERIPHEVGVVRLNDGVTVDDLLAWSMTETGPKPFTAAGGFGALPAGGSGWFYLDLPAGRYAAICFVHSPRAPYHSHAAMGQIVPFTVS